MPQTLSFRSPQQKLCEKCGLVSDLHVEQRDMTGEKRPQRQLAKNANEGYIAGIRAAVSR